VCLLNAFLVISPRLRPDTSAEFHHDLYQVSMLAIFRQSFVGNNKRLSEMTNACPCRQIYPKLRKAFVEIYHEPTCLVKKMASTSLSVFVGFS
jgi:hypothetical protein